MDATTLLVTMYCLVDEWLGDRRLRPRGPQPILADSEVLTIECVGEFLGIDTDKGLYEHFRRHYHDWFPALGRIHRPTFVRQRPTCGRSRPSSASSCSARLASTRPSRSWTVSQCRSAASVAPIAASGWRSWQAWAVTRAPSQTFYGLRRICGSAGRA
jgi:hypothetical protein